MLTYCSLAEESINARLDAVEGKASSSDGMSYLDHFLELVQEESKFLEIRDALKRLNKLDFDKLISSASFLRSSHHNICSNLVRFQLAASEVRTSNTAKVASARVTQMLGLQNIVRSLPFLQKALVGTKSQLLQIVYDVCSTLKYFEAALDDIWTQDAFRPAFVSHR